MKPPQAPPAYSTVREFQSSSCQCLWVTSPLSPYGHLPPPADLFFHGDFPVCTLLPMLYGTCTTGDVEGRCPPWPCEDLGIPLGSHARMALFSLSETLFSVALPHVPALPKGEQAGPQESKNFLDLTEWPASDYLVKLCFVGDITVQ